MSGKSKEVSNILLNETLTYLTLSKRNGKVFKSGDNGYEYQLVYHFTDTKLTKS